jgi:hypothetical protein
LQALLATATISDMKLLPTAMGTKPPSKFHGRYHKHMRMQAQKRRLEALRLYLDGKPVAEIAETIGVDYSTAWRYIRRENEACRLTNAEKAEAIRDQQFNQLNGIVAEAMAAWERSCSSGVQRISVTDSEVSAGKKHETRTEVERNPGDPRYLEVALKGLAEIRALYGIGAAESDSQVPFGGPVQIIAEWGGMEQPSKEPERDTAHREIEHHPEGK